MQFVLTVYQGSTHLPNTPAWDALSPGGQQGIYANYGSDQPDRRADTGLPLGLAQDAWTVTVRDGASHVVGGPYLGDSDRAAGGYSIYEAESIDEPLRSLPGFPMLVLVVELRSAPAAQTGDTDLRRLEPDGAQPNRSAMRQTTMPKGAPMKDYPDVDAYLAESDQWADEVTTIRPTLLACGLAESIKWGKPCYTIDDDTNIVLLQGSSTTWPSCRSRPQPRSSSPM